MYSIPGFHGSGFGTMPFGDFSNFDFGPGGVFNGPSFASTFSQQGQASSGFNGFNMPGMPGAGSNSIPGFTIPGMNASTFSGAPSLFPANGTSNLDPFTLFGGGNSFSGIPGGNAGLPQITGHDLKDIYGKGIGNALSQFLNSGAGFNSGVVKAEQNAAMPLEARGLEQIANLMGQTGQASSSTAAIGYGDFLSNFNAQLEQMYANQYEQSVQNYLNVLMGTKQDAKENKAQGNSWMNGAAQAAMMAAMFI